MKAVTRSFTVVACALALAACASAPPTERRAERLALAESVAGEPTDSIWYQRLVSWEPLSEEHLLIWTRANEAWLLRVDRPCRELLWTQSLGLRTATSSITTRFDYVVAGTDQCRIREIRPVDAQVMRRGRPSGGSIQVETGT
ncbi:MAG: DUF6491 family protein [Lysobacteraceae bacterium]|jgi:hypothetical protein